MSDYMKEAERLIAAHESAIRQHDRGAEWDEGPAKTLAALLACIQRGAVPDMYDRIAEAHDASLDEDHTGCRAILKECMRLLDAAPAPDHFRGAPAEVALQRGMARDNDALDEARAEHACSMGVGCGTSGACYAAANGQPELCQREQITAPALAEVPMPQSYAERPIDYTGGVWIESQMRTYGDAREAAGYARGLADERERCASVAWAHYMDTCRRKGIGPDVLPDWCCAAALRREEKL